MSYREIIVDGKTYRYSIGRTHVKFQGGPAVPYLAESSPMGSDFDDGIDPRPRVTPAHIRDYILAHLKQ